MEIEQSFVVPYPRDDVWQSFRDIPGIVGCLPGASLSAPPDDGALKLAMTVKLGPIVATFAGDGQMQLDDDAKRGSVSGAGVDRKSASRVKGEAAFALSEPEAGNTRVDVKVDYSISGSLAQFSRSGVVKELATRLTDAFADNLKAKLDAAAAERATASSSDTRAAGSVEDAPLPAADTPASNDARSTVVTSSPAAPREAPPLDLGNLFWKMLWTRLSGWFGGAGGSR